MDVFAGQKEWVINELGLGSLPQAKQDEILVALGENLLKKLTLSTCDLLTPAQQGEFGKLMEAGGPPKAFAYADQNINNFGLVAQEIVRKQIQTLKG